MDLLRTDDRDRHDWRSGAERQGDEATAPESAQLVALAEAFLHSPNSLGEHADQLSAPKQPLGILRAGAYAADSGHQRGKEGCLEDEVVDQRSQLARRRMVQPQCHLQHRAVVGEHRSPVVGDEQRPPLAWDLIDAAYLDAPPLPIEEHEERLDHLLELEVEAELVDTLGPANAIEAIEKRGKIRQAESSEPAIDHTGRGAHRVAAANRLLERTVEARELGLKFVDGSRRLVGASHILGRTHAPLCLSHSAIARRNARVGQRPRRR